MRRISAVVVLVVIAGLAGCGDGGQPKLADSTVATPVPETVPTTAKGSGTPCERSLAQVAPTFTPRTLGEAGALLKVTIGPCTTFQEWVEAADKAQLARNQPDDALVTAACQYASSQSQICQDANTFYRQTLPTGNTPSTTTTSPPGVPRTTAVPTTTPHDSSWSTDDS